MSPTDLPPVDTRGFFRPVSAELVLLLRGLKADDWGRPTVAGAWVVRDVLAHLVDVTLRRLSFHRDAMPPPPPHSPIGSGRDFVDVINALNAEWITTAKRFSPRVLTDLFELASTQLADWFEALPLEAPALFAVSWAGEERSEGWFDIGRDFTELWHHQEQIRMAVGATSLTDARYLQAVIDIAVRGLPYAFRHAPAEPGETVCIDITGPAGGQWTLTCEANGWTLAGGATGSPTARIHLTDVSAWKLLFNALGEREAADAILVEGRADLARPLLTARSVIV
jgi:uncharacterized protein (TIGR03083 family)